MNKSNIKYLSFEGGGGKCSTFLGAIKALEEKKSTCLVFLEKSIQDLMVRLQVPIMKKLRMTLSASSLPCFPKNSCSPIFFCFLTTDFFC